MTLRSFTPFPVSRRTFVRNGATLTAAAMVLPHELHASGSSGRDAGDAARDDQLRRDTATAAPDLVRSVALAAVDAAKAAGATYADVRLTRTVDQSVTLARTYVTAPRPFHHGATESEHHGVGVRVLVDGAWGFSASPYWTPGEGARLANDAVAQARQNARLGASGTELAPAPVATGAWTVPHEIDPFALSLEEKLAYLEDAIYEAPYRILDYYRGGYTARPVECQRIDTTLATTEGTFVTQQYYTTRAEIDGGAQQTDWSVREGAKWWRAPRGHAGLGTAGTEIPVLRQAYLQGSGWETVRDLSAVTRRIAEEAYAMLRHPSVRVDMKPVNIGRFTVVADAGSMAALVSMALLAMDLDRVSGEEANSAGTSWLGTDPLALLGTFDFGTPLLSVTANRALVGGPTHTKWDDDGVATQPFPLIQQGVLQDFATTRDTAMLLAPAYHKLGRTVRSNACAMASSAFEQPLLGTPDAVMTPGKESIGFNELVASVPRGLALVGLQPGDIQADMQLRQLVAGSPIDRPIVREIINGRLGAFVHPAAAVIDAPELWKNLRAIGGPSSLERWTSLSPAIASAGYGKGQPAQSFAMGVQAVPGIFTNVAIVNALRGA